jgi:uncharacterized protein with HEPN domain
MSKADIQRLKAYLGHILEAIERCHEYVEDIDEVAFLQDRKTQDAVIRTLEVVGEASNNIRKHYPEFVRQHPEVPFGFAYGMRNALAHGYFKVDFELVWKTIHNDLPGLYENVCQLLNSMD